MQNYEWDWSHEVGMHQLRFLDTYGMRYLSA